MKLGALPTCEDTSRSHCSSAILLDRGAAPTLPGSLRGNASLGPSLVKLLKEALMTCQGGHPDKHLTRRSLWAMSLRADTPFVFRAALNCEAARLVGLKLVPVEAIKHCFSDSTEVVFLDRLDG